MVKAKIESASCIKKPEVKQTQVLIISAYAMEKVPLVMCQWYCLLYNYKGSICKGMVVKNLHSHQKASIRQSLAN